MSNNWCTGVILISGLILAILPFSEGLSKILKASFIDKIWFKVIIVVVFFSAGVFATVNKENNTGKENTTFQDTLKARDLNYNKKLAEASKKTDTLRDSLTHESNRIIALQSKIIDNIVGENFPEIILDANELKKHSIILVSLHNSKQLPIYSILANCIVINETLALLERKGYKNTAKNSSFESERLNSNSQKEISGLGVNNTFPIFEDKLYDNNTVGGTFIYKFYVNWRNDSYLFVLTVFKNMQDVEIKKTEYIYKNESYTPKEFRKIMNKKIKYDIVIH